jgi:hypothetical protein
MPVVPRDPAAPARIGDRVEAAAANPVPPPLVRPTDRASPPHAVVRADPEPAAEPAHAVLRPVVVPAAPAVPPIHPTTDRADTTITIGQIDVVMAPPPRPPPAPPAAPAPERGFARYAAIRSARDRARW